MPRHRKGARGFLVLAYAPHGTGAAAANRAFNAYVADRARGLVLAHDHFVDRPGGYAVFVCDDGSEAERLRIAPELPGWTLTVHPLAFARNAVRWFYQVDFTLTQYRGIPMEHLLREYLASEEHARLHGVPGAPEPAT